MNTESVRSDTKAVHLGNDIYQDYFFEYNSQGRIISYRPLGSSVRIDPENIQRVTFQTGVKPLEVSELTMVSNVNQNKSESIKHKSIEIGLAVIVAILASRIVSEL